MIKRTDLRLGNIILFDGVIDEVTSIGKFINGNNHGRYSEDRLDGVPITEGVLTDLGYISKDSVDWDYPGTGGLLLYEGKVDDEFHEEVYVHKLQNYVYARYGVELSYRRKI